MKPIRPFSQDIRKLMDSFIAHAPYEIEKHVVSAAASIMPSFQLQETTDEYLLKAHLPQMRVEDIEIILQQRMLTIRGERKESIVGRNDRNGMYMRQSEFSSFQRSFAIPTDALIHKMKVERDHERLLIRIPKR